MTRVDIRGVSKHFGGVRVLDQVSLVAEPGRVTALIGPNGAGKSTLVNVVSGYVKPSEGSVWLDELDITRFPTSRRASLGVGRTFQNLELFHGMTVEDNTVLGRYRKHCGWRRWFTGPGASDRRSVAGIIEELSLADHRDQDSESLSFGQAKLVEPARVLAMDPSVIVMDEPAAGLTAAQTADLGRWIVEVAAKGIAVLLIEHNMGLIMEIADYIYVLDSGSLIGQGTPAEVQASQAVLDAYLGVVHSD